MVLFLLLMDFFGSMCVFVDFVEAVAWCSAQRGSGEELRGGVHAEWVALIYSQECLEGGEGSYHLVSEEEGDEDEVIRGYLGVTRGHSVTAATNHILAVYFYHLFRTRLLY